MFEIEDSGTKLWNLYLQFADYLKTIRRNSDFFVAFDHAACYTNKICSTSEISELDNHDISLCKKKKENRKNNGDYEKNEASNTWRRPLAIVKVLKVIKK